MKNEELKVSLFYNLDYKYVFDYFKKESRVYEGEKLFMHSLCSLSKLDN